VKVLRGYAMTSFGQVHYRYAGTAGKPVLVLLHQTPSTSAMYEALILELADDYRLFAPDLPGMGLSDPVAGDMTVRALADAMVEVLDELGVEDCLLFGHHTGASVAAELAARRPERVSALALSGPPLLDEPLKARLPSLAAPIPVREDGAHFTEMWQRTRGKDTKAPLAIVQRETLSGIELGRGYPDAYCAVAAHDMQRALSALTCPVLVFAGTGDLLHGRLDAALALLARGTKREIPNARTYVCETHCLEVATMLREFYPGAAA
jgi:pimeloyl-ACP methyl ester carboxylesterase